MLAVFLVGHGGLDKLVIKEDAPMPGVKQGEALIEVGACALNNTDVWTREGAYGTGTEPHQTSGWRRDPMQFPRIQGVDIVGRIVSVGKHVPESRLGERVLVDPILYSDTADGLENCRIIGSERDGGYAEFVNVPAECALPVQSDYSDVELASFPTAYGTALGMLNRAQLTARDTILITGASGGVGSALVQLAKLRGARIIAVVGAGKGDRVKELGVDHIIFRGMDLSRAIADLNDELKVTVVADVVGGPNFPDLLRVLNHRGRYVTAGAIAGPVVQLDLRTVYLKYLDILGSTMWTRKEFLDLISYIEQCKLKPLVSKTYPLAHIHRAQQDFMEKRFVGKLVLIPTIN